MRFAVLIVAGFSVLALGNDTIDLMEDLNLATEISTRTKLNIDKTPAVVSVLHGEQLKRLGVNNLFEALETVPGIETSMGTAGAKQINMRGNKSIVRDKLKLMLNGISVNTEVTGAGFFYLDMPIELIERIEVIRGPSSALYGSFAHIGAINVITKNASEPEGLLFGNASSEGYSSTGFVQSAEIDGMQASFDGFYIDNEQSRSYGPYDFPGMTQTVFTSFEDFTNVSLGASLNFANDISFQTRWLELDLTNHYGYGDFPIIANPMQLKSTSFLNEVRYNPELTSETSLDVKAGYRRYVIKGGARTQPLSHLLGINDLIGYGMIEEGTLYGDAALNHIVGDHQLLGGIYLAKAKIEDTYYLVNDPVVSEVTNVIHPVLPDNVVRHQYAAYLHDIYTLSEQWTLNVGARYDHYSDADSNLAPKVALLYTHNDQESYKFMYQRSFRAPTLLELYGNNIPLIGDASLDTETIDTVEFAYTHTTAFDNRFTANIFYSNLQDFIHLDGFNYVNGESIRSYGAELEWHYPFSETMSMQSNYSYVRAKEKDGDTLPYFANHLANVMLSKQWDRHWQSGTMLRYVGKRQREVDDTRSDLDGYTRFDQTVTYTNNGYTLQVAVKNLFDDDIRYPAQLGDGVTMGTYVNDFPRDGRTFWVSLQWRLP